MGPQAAMGYDWLVQEARKVRSKLRYPFAKGLAEQELVEGTLDQVLRLGHLFAGDSQASWIEWVRTQLLQLAKDREEAAANKYSKILFEEAKRIFPDYGLPQARLDFRDLVQSALERAVEKHEKIKRDGEGQFVNSLKKLFINNVRNLRDHHRAKLRDHQREAGQELDGSSARRDKERFDPHQTTPSEDIQRRLFLGRIADALRALDAREKEALRLRFGKGWNWKQIGDALEVSQEDAGLLVTLALDSIREHVDETVDGVNLERFTVRQFIREFFESEEAADEQSEPEVA